MPNLICTSGNLQFPETYMTDVDTLANAHRCQKRRLRIPPEAAIQAVESFLDGLIGSSPATKIAYRRILTWFLSFTDKPASRIESSDLVHYLAHCEKELGLSAASLRLRGVVVRKFLGGLGLDVSKIKLPSWQNSDSGVYVRSEDYSLILNVASQDRDRLILQLLLNTGLRVGELCNLRVGDIDAERRRLTVRYRGSRERFVPVDSDTIARVQKYIKNKDMGRRDHVVEISPRQVENIVRKHAVIAGLPDADRITPHDLRHSFAIKFLTMGGDIRTLQKILGHRSISTTEIYLDYKFEEVQRAYGRIFERTAA